MIPFILFAAFVTVPVIEIALFIQVGGLIGLWPTLLTVIATAFIGTTLLRMQGMKVLADAQNTLNQGGMPVEPAIHGVFLLISGLTLLTPGFMTDAVGLILFIPPVRLWLGRKIFNWLKDHAQVQVYQQSSGFQAGGFQQPRAPQDSTPFEPPFGEPGFNPATSTPDQTDPAVVDLNDDDFRGEPDDTSPWAQNPKQD